MQIRTLCEKDIDLVYEFEKSRLPEGDMSAEMLSWTACWRRESLEFYLPNGWCFGFFTEQGQFRGYFMAQPLLFFRSMTQNLWVEHISFQTDEQANFVIETAYKLARSKHLQSVMFYKGNEYKNLLEKYNPEVISEDTLLIRTTKS